MKWKKLGSIFTQNDSALTHSTLPFIRPSSLSSSKIEIIFSSRSLNNKSKTFSAFFDPQNNFDLRDIKSLPIITPGNLGEFDDSGSMASCIVEFNNKEYLYYIGWNLGITVPFRNSIGLCIAENNGRDFKKFSNGPILDRSFKEPHFCASSCVLKDESIIKMWYLSCVKWEIIDGKCKHFYHIKYAESKDGINWVRDGKIAIDFKDSYEYAISTPRVIKEDGIYKMWYSFRSQKNINTYRIGYAESKTGVDDWVRKDDEVGIDVSDSGWDSQMICYPSIFDHNGNRYMLYNGNDYGKTGFGIAILEKD